MKNTNVLCLLSAALVACAPTTLSRPDAAADTSSDRTSPADVRSDTSSRPDVDDRDVDARVTDTGVADAAATDSGLDVAAPIDASSADGAMDAAMDGGGFIEDAATRDAASDGSAADASSADVLIGDGATGSGGYMLVRNVTGASCDTSSAWTDTGVTGDDDAMTAPVAMPFSVGYFGQTATHFSASTNGLVQLWPGASGTPSTDYSNDVLPSATAPEGAVAVFWDDLYVPPTGSVRYATLGAAPGRRFVVEYNDVDTIDEEQTLRFQAKFFEGTNVIELHYCAMSTIGFDDRHTGESATIGAQNFARTQGIDVSTDTAGATPSGTWFRLVPR
jgi:hypothetical protein